MELKPLKRKGLSEDIAERILGLIRDKKYLPGDKLPPERELMEMLQVSRPSLREAMRSLAFMNVIEIRQGDGTYITSLDPEILIERLDFVFAVDDSSQLQLLHARRIIEPGVAASAARRITDEEIETLTACVNEAQNHAADIPKYVELDIKFHTIIVEATQNPLLIRIMRSLSYLDRLARVNILERASAPTRAKEIAQVYQEHVRILDALRNRDAPLAQKAMQQHIENIENLVRAIHGSHDS